jgi:aryl-alcohol dehydrogenase-like predicted oxidoreductase
VLEDVGLMAFSPMGAGFLTGKYQSGVPDGSRMSLVPEMGGRNSARVRGAVAAYLDVAERHGIDPVHMAMSFAEARPFMASVIFGATDTGQLARLLAGIDVRLSAECLADIDKAHRANPMPY